MNFSVKTTPRPFIIVTIYSQLDGFGLKCPIWQNAQKSIIFYIVFVHCDKSKKNKKIFQKGIDKAVFIWYNKAYSKERATKRRRLLQGRAGRKYE
jgi:hypothetical protein